MAFITGFAVWLAIGIGAGFLSHKIYAAPATTFILTLTFGVFGAFIGGMLGTSPYIHHDAVPLRLGGLLGATIFSLFVTWLYHFTARKAI